MTFPGAPPSLRGRAALAYPIAGNGPTNIITPIFSNFLPAATTNTYNGGFQTDFLTASTGLVTSTTVRRVPVPLNSTLSGLYTNLVAVQSGATVTDIINGTAGTVGCTYSGTTPFSCTSANSDSLNAGDLLMWQFNPHGGTWAQGTTPGQISALLTTNSGQQAAILTGPAGGAASPTQYYPIGAGGQNATSEVTMSQMFSTGGTLTGLYVIPNGADTGTNQHVYTVCKNGTTACAATPQLSGGLWCQDGSDALGCCVNATGSGNIGGVKACTAYSGSVSVSAGDTISVQAFCFGSAPNTIGTCNTVIPGIALIFQPTVTNQVPLFASTTNATTTYLGLSDATAAAPQTAQTSYQLIGSLTTPTQMTFANPVACTTNAIGGTGTRITDLQAGTTPTTAPTTISGPTVSATGAACPNTTGTFLAGNTGTGSYVASAGYTLDWLLHTTGTVGSTGFYKVGMTVTVP